MRMILLQLGSRVRHRQDNGWDAPGCVVAQRGKFLRVFWPDTNTFSNEHLDDLVLYDQTASQPVEVAA